MQTRKIRILGTGTYLPETIVTAEELDRKLNVPAGWVAKKSGVLERRFVKTETASQMGAIAIKNALINANVELTELDCIVSASGVGQQPIPCTASLIQEQLGLDESGISCFDINTTCLSFVAALDIMSYLVEAGRYKKVAIVSSEIASVGLNWEQKESACLFGDASAAVIIGKTENEQSSKIISSLLETYSKGAHFTEIRGGGTSLTAAHFEESRKADFLFDMDGRSVFKLSSKILPGFMERFLNPNGIEMKDIKMVIPHQASAMAMRIMREKLGIEEEKFMNIIENHGNTIASSIPLALNEAIKRGKIQRGDLTMLIGTSAGLSIGGIVLEY